MPAPPVAAPATWARPTTLKINMRAVRKRLRESSARSQLVVAIGMMKPMDAGTPDTSRAGPLETEARLVLVEQSK